MKHAALTLTLLAAFTGNAVADAGDVVRFISCPIYRDTDAGRKSGCWLADDPATGIRYDVTPSPTKPDWNYAVLVEGRVSETQENQCGGVTLEPARVSLLFDTRCTRHMLPAEDFPGRWFVLPKRNVRPTSEARPVPQPPFEDRTFHLFFDFGRSMIVYQYTDYLLDQAATWIKGAKPKHLVVTGFAATDPAMVSGREIAEPASLARERAEKMAESLARLGIPRDIITVRWETASQPVDVDDADGLPEASRQRVEIRAEF